MSASAAVNAPVRLRAAYVQRAHGVRGEVRAEPLGGDAARFAPGLRLVREADGRLLTVRAARGLPDGEVLLAFEEVTDRDAADALRGAYLCVERSDARRLGDQEWFDHDLVGLRALGPDGAVVGTVTDVEHYVEQDVLVVEGEAGTRRFPLVHAFVSGVDLGAGTVALTPWEEEG